jgi:hypothetical protein
MEQKPSGSNYYCHQTAYAGEKGQKVMIAESSASPPSLE